MATERKREITEQIPVLDMAGKQRVVLKRTTFSRLSLVDGSYSDWAEGSHDFICGGEDVNRLNEHEFELVISEELLRRDTGA